jgi:hypothetical protein
LKHLQENPGALAGATEANLETWFLRFTNNIRRQGTASDLSRAIFKCDPADRLPFLGIAEDFLSVGTPMVGFGPIMCEAREWAAWVSRKELKAYAVASYDAMSLHDQAAFRSYINRLEGQQ